ncbi:uncharacterized protein [Dermacentor albipictus]|uniref:uncharacterized protein n=1 Tax=Dermacentor albipictus TaxID=60249 RepID=UPI0038FBFFFF
MLSRAPGTATKDYSNDTEDVEVHAVAVMSTLYGGSSYLSVFDAHSNFPEVEKLTRTTSSAVIEKLSAIFSRYGIPMEVRTDNGPQFSSYEFALFASRYDFSHVTSSPEFPRSNGLAEKGVQIVKRILKKTEETKQDFWLGLLNYRSTPLEYGRSPGELLQGRRLRTLLPDFRQQPSIPVFKRAQADTRGRTLPPLNTGDVVRVQEKTWNRRAQVTEAVAPRSYRVVTEDNRVLRRNRQHLLPTGELFQQEALECEDRESERACEALQPTAPAATGDSPVSSENIPQAPPPVTTTGPTVSSTAPQALTLRRSTRDRRPPQRLRYDRNFNQDVPATRVRIANTYADYGGGGCCAGDAVRAAATDGDAGCVRSCDAHGGDERYDEHA